MAPSVKLTPELGLEVSPGVIPLPPPFTQPKPADSPQTPQLTPTTGENVGSERDSGSNPSEGNDSACKRV